MGQRSTDVNAFEKYPVIVENIPFIFEKPHI